MKLNFGKASLFHKTLLLVCVPLAFELGFLATMAALLNQAEHEADQQAHSNAVVSHTDLLLKHFYNAGTYLAGFALMRNPALEERFDNSLAAIPKEFNALEELVRSDPQEQQAVKNVQPIVEEGLKLFSETKQALVEDSNAWMYMRSHKLTKKMEGIVSKLLPELQKITDYEAQRSALAPQAEERTRALVKQILWGAVAFNIVLAISLAIFVSRGWLRRIAALVDNTARLAAGRTLQPPLGGSDEIAQLESTFHSMAQALDDAAAKEREAEKAKQDFIAIIGHDLKTPLTFVRATLTFLDSGVIDSVSEKGKQKIKDAEEETTRLVTMIDDLLELAKLKSGTFKISVAAVPLWLIVERSCRAVSELAQQRQVTIERKEIDCEILGDAERLVQVLVNLLANAVSLSPRGGKVAVTVETQADTAKVIVSDNGPGVREEDRELIFERFKQASDSAAQKSGSGLGLSICKAIISEHKGEIGVTGATGGGSSFWFTLPTAQSSTPADDAVIMHEQHSSNEA